MIRSFSVLLAVAFLFGACALRSQLTAAPFGDWHYPGGNHFSVKYSLLDQIDSNKFADLEVAWDWQSAKPRISRSLASNICRTVRPLFS
jgi:glucose dehydrogenase